MIDLIDESIIQQLKEFKGYLFEYCTKEVI